jgi:hypothetical protein
MLPLRREATAGDARQRLVNAHIILTAETGGELVPKTLVENERSPGEARSLAPLRVLKESGEMYLGGCGERPDHHKAASKRKYLCIGPHREEYVVAEHEHNGHESAAYNRRQPDPLRRGNTSRQPPLPARASIPLCVLASIHACWLISRGAARGQSPTSSRHQK